MNTTTAPSSCACQACPGATCTCGCQVPAAPASSCGCGCQSGDPCRCGQR